MDGNGVRNVGYQKIITTRKICVAQGLSGRGLLGYN